MNVLGGEPFVTWPMQSPTSRLGINLRFYYSDDGEVAGPRYRVDIGVANEATLEQMYDDFQLAVKSVTRTQFEEAMRGLFQQRLASINAYSLATTLYVALTTDPKEVSRLSQRERKVLASQSRRLPYTTYPQYQTRPTTFGGQVKRFFGNLRVRLFPSL